MVLRSRQAALGEASVWGQGSLASEPAPALQQEERPAFALLEDDPSVFPLGKGCEGPGVSEVTGRAPRPAR